jgi:hypothetical protein
MLVQMGGFLGRIMENFRILLLLILKELLLLLILHHRDLLVLLMIKGFKILNLFNLMFIL